MSVYNKLLERQLKRYQRHNGKVPEEIHDLLSAISKSYDHYERDRKLPNLMLDPYFKRKMQKGQDNWRQIIALAATNGIPAPAFMSSLAYFDSYRSKRLPANLLQGQRDYFGAHTYERVDEPRGKKFHVDWPEADRPELKA